MSYKGIFHTDKLSEVLNIPSLGDVYIDTSEDEVWDCYSDADRNAKSNTTAMYWNNLSDEERVERLENHGMTGKKHSKETREKMSKSAMGTNRPTLHKGGTVISPTGKVVNYSTLSHFCQEHGLSCGHMSELMNGKVRKSVKGWTRG
jgi:hypothetical protein